VSRWAIILDKTLFEAGKNTMLSGSVRTVLLGCLFCCAVTGCGESVVVPNWPDVVPCTGSVTMGGKPLTQTMVLFIPDVSTQGQGGSAQTDDSGKYTVSSRNSKGETVPGIIPGKYKIAFSRMVKPDGSVWIPDATNSAGPATFGAREELPLKYSDPANSIQIAEVKAGGAPVDFDLRK